MRSFPLVRLRWSNEHIMAALFVVLLLYMLPVWIDDPGQIVSFIPVLLLSLAIDATAGFIRYKKPVCSVSAAVTACILQLLASEIPLWCRLLGVTAALLVGKHIWGGTGKNLLNPAITGVFLLSFLFKLEPSFAEPSLLYIPAILFSLPFLLFRPFAGIGLMAGLALAMLTSWSNQPYAIVITCIFFGCLVITDPTTTTHKPAEGLIGGLAAGYIPLLISNSISSLFAGILIFNLISYLIDLRVKTHKSSTYRNLLNIKRIVPLALSEEDLLDLTIESAGETPSAELPKQAEILNQIEKHGVFGMGGAGFSTADKIRTTIESKSTEKLLVINAAECDPGLVHDKWLLKYRIEQIYKGVEALDSCLGFKRIYLAAKDVSDIPQKVDITLVKLPDLYPTGAEKILTGKIPGIRQPKGQIPAKEGILILNVQTLLAIYDAVYLDKDADTRYLTVSDIKNKKSRVVRVKLGDRIHDVLEKAYPGSNLAFAGGGIMQSHIASDEDVIEKSVNYIASAGIPKYKESLQCSKCGLCRSSCPAGLESGRIADLVDTGKVSMTSPYNPELCLNCGTCSYVCLAGRNLSARVNEAGTYVKAQILK